MSLSGSRDNVIANLLQQGSGVLLFLFIPRILGIDDYSRLIIINTLVSLAVVADLGIGHIYTRIVPGIIAAGENDTARTWDVTVFLFRLMGGAIFGAFAGIYFGLRTGAWGDAIGLLFLFPLTTVSAFLLSRCVVGSRFDEVKNISAAQSLGRLVSIPGAALSGVPGWLGGQILSYFSLLLFSSQRRQLNDLFGQARLFSWALVKKHLPEAFSLCLIATVWAQFMTSARLYAVLNYPDNVIANYGLAGAFYQIGTSLVIAAFVPQTVRFYRMLSSDLPGAINYAFRIAAVGAAIVLLGTVFAIFVAPHLLSYLFPKYRIETPLLTPLLLSVVDCVVVSVFGSVLIGTGKSKIYLGTLLLCFSMNMLFAVYLEPFFLHNAASVAQLLALSCYSLALLGISYWYFGQFVERKIGVCVAAACPVAVVFLAAILNPGFY